MTDHPAVAPVSARVPLSEAALPREEPRAEPRAALSEPDVAAIREDAKYATDAQSRRQIVQLCDSHESLRIALASARSALDAKDAELAEAKAWLHESRNRVWSMHASECKTRIGKECSCGYDAAAPRPTTEDGA